MEDEQQQKLSDPVRDGLEYPLHEESSRPPAAIGMNPEDMMPQQIPGVALKDSLAPRLSLKRLICMADTSEFVIRNQWGEIHRRWSPQYVERTPDGTFRLVQAEHDKLPINELKMKLEPLRPQCVHYVRQLIPWPDDTTRTRCQRYCSALKNDQGELFSLNDTELLACELRCPRDFEADKQIDEFDRMVIEKGELAAQEQAEFDIDSALAKENLGVLGGGNT